MMSDVRYLMADSDLGLGMSDLGSKIISGIRNLYGATDQNTRPLRCSFPFLFFSRFRKHAFDAPSNNVYTMAMIAQDCLPPLSVGHPVRGR